MQTMDNSDCYNFGQPGPDPDQRAEGDPFPTWELSTDCVAQGWSDHVPFSGQPFDHTNDAIGVEDSEGFWNTKLSEQWEQCEQWASTGGDEVDNPSADTRGVLHDRRIFTPSYDGQLLSPISTEPLSSPQIGRATGSTYPNRANDYCTSRVSSSSRLTPSEDEVVAGSPVLTSSATPPKHTSISSSTKANTARPKQKSKATALPGSSRSKARSHNNIERHYRTRLNEHFSMLMNVLPKELTIRNGANGDKALSKIEILDLSKSHIAFLEREGEQLQEEKMMLKGQVQLLRRLVELHGESVL